MAIFCSVSRCIFVTFREEANNFHTVICAIHPKEITLNNVEWPFYVKIMASVGMSVNLSACGLVRQLPASALEYVEQ